MEDQPPIDNRDCPDLPLLGMIKHLETVLEKVISVLIILLGVIIGNMSPQVNTRMQKLASLLASDDDFDLAFK